MNVAEHLERNLGPISTGWSSSSLAGVQVCLFEPQPGPGLFTLATLGLSLSPLGLTPSKSVRQELLFVVQDFRPPNEFVQLVLHVADELTTKRRGLLRGEVVALESRIAADSDAMALYASLPVVFSDSLATLDTTIPPTVFVWLFPVLPAEVQLIQSAGWEAFEDRLEAEQPDLFDFSRCSVV